jgi:hypothetical protein
MSSTPSGSSFKDHSIGSIPALLASIINSSSDILPSEPDIDRLRKEVDDFYNVTRKQANRYQKDLETLSSRHGTADQARRRDAQKSAKIEEGTFPLPPPSAEQYFPFPGQPVGFLGVGLLTFVLEVIDSGSESDVPLRKKRKLDDSSRASTPRLATPKGTFI